MEVSHRVHLSKMCSLYTTGKRVSNHVISINEPLCGILLKYLYFKKMYMFTWTINTGKKHAFSYVTETEHDKEKTFWHKQYIYLT